LSQPRWLLHTEMVYNNASDYRTNGLYRTPIIIIIFVYYAKWQHVK